MMPERTTLQAVPGDEAHADVEIHPIADLFPMLADDELQELADDIAANGLLQPIVLDAEGRVIDGRNRLVACNLARVEPTFQTYTGAEPETYAISVNLSRRHLTKGQRAMLAAKALFVTNIGQVRAANSAETSQSRVSKAKVVLDHAPDLADAVIAGTRSLDEAYAEARRRKADLDSDEIKLARLNEWNTDLADCVNEGRLALDEAYAAAQIREDDRLDRIATTTANLRRALDLLPIDGDPAWLEWIDWTEVDEGKVTAAAEWLSALGDRIGRST